MDDAALEAEFNALLDTKPDGWFVEMEAFHPIFLGFQVAPDETPAVETNTEEIIVALRLGCGLELHWVSTSTTIPQFRTGHAPDGTVLCSYYGGLG